MQFFHSSVIIFFIIFNFCCINSIEFHDEKPVSLYKREVEKITFDKLNNIVLLAILDEMDLEELLVVAQLGVKYRELIEWHYALPIFEIPKKLIIIDFREYFHKHKFHSCKDSIHLYSIGFALKFIRTFGHMISKLQFDNIDFHSNKSQVLSKYISDFSSESLTEICFRKCRNIDNKWNKPFENIEKITFMLSPFKGDTACQLNMLFPNMHNLELNWITEATDTRCLYHHFPHLKYFDFISYNTSSRIENFSTMNPQLQSLSFWAHSGSESLQFINETHPKLKSLRLLCTATKHFMQNHTDVYFADVIRFKATFTFKPNYIPFRFNQLEEFELSTIEIHDQWIQFIMQQTRLKKLVIKASILSSDHWTEIAKNLAELIEMSVEWKQSKSQTIAKIIETFQSLHRVTLIGMKEMYRSYYSDIFGSEWKIDENQQNKFHTTFSRNTPKKTIT